MHTKHSKAMAPDKLTINKIATTHCTTPGISQPITSMHQRSSTSTGFRAGVLSPSPLRRPVLVFDGTTGTLPLNAGWRRFGPGKLTLANIAAAFLGGRSRPWTVARTRSFTASASTNVSLDLAGAVMDSAGIKGIRRGRPTRFLPLVCGAASGRAQNVSWAGRCFRRAGRPGP